MPILLEAKKSTSKPRRLPCTTRSDAIAPPPKIPRHHRGNNMRHRCLPAHCHNTPRSPHFWIPVPPVFCPGGPCPAPGSTGPPAAAPSRRTGAPVCADCARCASACSLDLGRCDHKCDHCKAMRFSAEGTTFCCQGGKYAIDFDRYFKPPGTALTRIYAACWPLTTDKKTKVYDVKTGVEV